MVQTTRFFTRFMGRWLMALLLVMLSSLATKAAEAYACYTSSNTTLTFYYDSQRSSRPGIKFDMNEGSERPRWITSGYNANVTSVVISPSFANARPTSTYYWFYHMNQITTVNGLNYLNTEAVTNMSNMFYECSNLTSLDVSGFNTSNVTDMGQMFCECSRLTALDVSHFNTANVVNMTQMFCFCSSLTALDVSDFNTANVTTMYGLFQGCLKLTALDVSNFTTPKAMRLSLMFQGCSKLTALDVSNFNTANVTEMNSMFNGCSNLTTIYASSLWRTDAVTSSTNMFKGCTSLVGGMGTTYDADHVDAAYAHIDGGTSNPGYFTEKGPEAYACYTPANTTLTFYYDNQRSSRPGTTYDLNEGSNEPGWYNDLYDQSTGYIPTTRVVFDPSFAAARPTSTCCWFSAMEDVESIEGLEYLNTSEVTNMEGMFSQCRDLTSLDLSNFNTAKVTNMDGMFYYCWSLMRLDLSSFNTAKVTDMGYMFSQCRDLTSLDLSNFNTAKVTNMEGMFYYCMSLTSLDLSSFNTANVTDMGYMFYGCRWLTSLDLSSFNTAKVTNMKSMFKDCISLNYIYADNGWSTAAVTSSDLMFDDCFSLVGGKGTTYDENHVDATRAHIDGGPSNPGYFTDVNAPRAYACYTPGNTTLTFYYDDQCSSRPGTTYDLVNVTPGWVKDLYDESTSSLPMTRVVFDPSFASARPTSTYGWFAYMVNLESIVGIGYLNTSEVTNMEGMFYYCMSLTSLDLSSFNTANVTTMYGMFQYCSNLRTIYVSDSWSTAAVLNSDFMFDDCTSLVGGMGTTYDENHVDAARAHIDGGPSNPGYFTMGIESYACYTPENTTLTFYYDDQRYYRPGTTYDLVSVTPGWYNDLYDQSTNSLPITRVVFDPSFAGARPTSTYGWFACMCNLQSITGMEYLNTSEVTNMFAMFYLCYSLTRLDLSNFNTSKVTDMGSMFDSSRGLTSLDLSSFNTAKVTNMESMFEDCRSLTYIYADNGWSTAAVTYSDYMFYDCTSLVGGMGTTYDENYMDAARAHIDGGPSNPGYFTAKSSFLRGDVNGDGQVKISDVTALINYLLSGDASAINLQSADVNQDGQVKISDVTALINYLLSGTWN